MPCLQEHTFSMPALHAAAEMGFAGLFVGEDVGGLGVSRTDGAAIFAALARGDVSHTAWLTIHNMVAGCIDRRAYVMRCRVHIGTRSMCSPMPLLKMNKSTPEHNGTVIFLG